MIRAFRPQSLDEALAVLADRDLGAVPLAGATDLMAGLHAGATAPAAVVDVLRLEALRGVRLDGDWVDLGAATTFSELRRHPLVATHAPLLAEAAATVGAWQIQNRATLGGNIGTGSPAGDSLPVLLALGAELVCARAGSERRLPYAEVHRAYRRLALEPGELIVRVRVPRKPASGIHAFRKVGTRAAQAVSKVSAAFAARLDGGRLGDVRFAAGSVAAVPVRLRKVELACEDERPTAALAERAAALAHAAVKPIDDVRSTAEYRAFVLAQLVRRMLLDAGR